MFGSMGRRSLAIVVGNNCIPGLVENTQKATSFNLNLIFLNLGNCGHLDSPIKRYSTLSLTIPEAFIWKFIESLVEALRLCNTGERYFEKGALLLGDWDRIVHMNILPGKVFLL